MRYELHRSRMMRFALLTTSYGIVLSSYAGGVNCHERQVGQSYANLTVGGISGVLADATNRLWILRHGDYACGDHTCNHAGYRVPLMPLAYKITDADRLPGLYEADYQRWLFENAALLRQGRFSQIDAVNIAEELEDVGRSETRALGSHLAVLQLHLLKWQFQPERRGSSWRGSIYNARCAIADLLADSPSLRNRLSELVAKHYRRTRINAANETGLPEKTFPEECPYAIDALQDEGFWPD